jgi:hypothetical protein
MARLHYRVDFNASCGAQNHPAFVRKTYRRADRLPGRLSVDFPVDAEGMLKSKYAQRDWAVDAHRHLRAFSGSEPTIFKCLGPGVWVEEQP